MRKAASQEIGFQIDIAAFVLGLSVVILLALKNIIAYDFIFLYVGCCMAAKVIKIVKQTKPGWTDPQRRKALLAMFDIVSIALVLLGGYLKSKDSSIPLAFFLVPGGLILILSLFKDPSREHILIRALLWAQILIIALNEIGRAHV